jgi:uncharacterized beta-barrel protein YwiB (DUF1934 family)
MDKKVVLTITGVQRIADQDKTVELVTMGRFFKESGIYYIEYEDSIITGFDGNKTLITIDGEKILLERTGTLKTHLLFEKGKKYVNCYDTPFGMHEMGIYPTSIELNMGQSHGKLDLKYQLEVGGQYAGANELSVIYNATGRNGGYVNKAQRT